VLNPIYANCRSEPQADIVLLQPRPDFYRSAHPLPDQVLLLIEVADTSIRQDQGRKLTLYARAGVAEYWIVNRQAEAVEVYRSPSGGGYREHAAVRREGHVAPSAFPELRLLVDEILG